MTRLARIALLTAAVTALVAPPARAGLLPTSVTVTPEAGNFRWTYAVAAGGTWLTTPPLQHISLNSA